MPFGLPPRLTPGPGAWRTAAPRHGRALFGVERDLRERGDAEVPNTTCSKVRRWASTPGLPDWKFRHRRAQARFSRITGDLAGALASLDEAQRHYRPNPVPDVCPLAAMRRTFWLAQGRLGETQRWAHARNLAVDDTLTFLREFEHITLARLLLAEFGPRWRCTHPGQGHHLPGSPPTSCRRRGQMGQRDRDQRLTSTRLSGAGQPCPGMARARTRLAARGAGRVRPRLCRCRNLNGAPPLHRRQPGHPPRLCGALTDALPPYGIPGTTRQEPRAILHPSTD